MPVLPHVTRRNFLSSGLGALTLATLAPPRIGAVLAKDDNAGLDSRGVEKTGLAGSNPVSNEIYACGSFRLNSDAFIEGQLKAMARSGCLETSSGEIIDTKVDRRFPQISSDCPMLDAMYGIALRDHERLTINRNAYYFMLCNRFKHSGGIPKDLPLPEGSVFWAGYGFYTYLYDRDVAYSSWLGTAWSQPEVVASHLKYLRGLRKKIGLKVAIGHEIPIPGIPTEQTGMTHEAMSDKYNTQCYTRRTDDIVWLLGLWEVFKVTRDESLLAYMLEEFAYFDEHFYRYFLDNKIGLYRGQSTFIDVSGAPYGGRSPGQTVMLKALSTNCLYVGGFEILRQAAAWQGRSDLADAFRKRRDDLAEAIRTHFGAVNYQHYLDDEGGSSGRQEVLGLAFLTLFNVLPLEEGAKLLASYHDGDFGRPLLWPFCGSSRIYHDNATWPFANTIFALAEYKAGNKQAVIRKTMGGLCRHSLNGNFNEVIEWKNGRFVGCPGYIWSAASYLTLVYKMIAGMEINEAGKLSFAPVLPAELGNRFEISELKLGKMDVNLRIRGNGEKIASCFIDGKESQRAELDMGGGKHAVEITLR